MEWVYPNIPIPVLVSDDYDAIGSVAIPRTRRSSTSNAVLEVVLEVVFVELRILGEQGLNDRGMLFDALCSFLVFIHREGGGFVLIPHEITIAYIVGSLRCPEIPTISAVDEIWHFALVYDFEELITFPNTE